MYHATATATIMRPVALAGRRSHSATPATANEMPARWVGNQTQPG